MSRRVAIIGGGFGGLAAAVALSERGAKVLLLERRNHLGGRAYSFLDSKTGCIVDNGQHLFMGCYRETIAFLKKIGSLDRVEFQDRLRVDFLEKRGAVSLACPRLPPPFHLLAGLLRMRGLTLGDKLRAIKAGRALGSSDEVEGRTVSQWLRGLDQSARINELFWHPLSIATLNESPDMASARMLLVVLKNAFTGSRFDSSLGMSRVGLSDLYTESARRFIESRNGEVRTNAAVEKLAIENKKAKAAILKSGERIEADFFISAVPPRAFLEMLSEDIRRNEFAEIGRLNSSPIVSINLWFDRPVVEYRFAGLIGARIQWLFNKDLIIKESESSNHLALIISAARGFIDLSKEELVSIALEDLHALAPESRKAKLVHSLVVKEREATLSHSVESDRLRPDARTSIANLILAGDWTATGLPATIESAVMSGHRAADLVSV
ncbi:MAG: hydroxysqualene dehydroxylase HpnE [Acidobacteriota bacterium]